MNKMLNVISERTEIAKAINFGKYPVLTLNIGECVPGYEGLFKGSEVRVACETKSHGTLYAHCRLTFERTEENLFPSKIDLIQGATVLKNSFGYNDVMDMMKWANTPIVKAGQEVVVIFVHPDTKFYLVTLYKVNARVNLHCMTVATLEVAE